MKLFYKVIGGHSNVQSCSKVLFPAQITSSSFELIIFELGRSCLVLCIVIYWPPEYKKHFLNDFSDDLIEVISKYDQVLIIWDFNIRVCCPKMSPIKD